MRKPEGKKPLGRPRRRWEDNIKMDLQEVGWDGGMDFFDLAQDSDRWLTLVNAVMSLLLALQPSLGVVFYSPLAGFSLLAYEVS